MGDGRLWHVWTVCANSAIAKCFGVTLRGSLSSSLFATERESINLFWRSPLLLLRPPSGGLKLPPSNPDVYTHRATKSGLAFALVQDDKPGRSFSCQSISLSLSVDADTNFQRGGKEVSTGTKWDLASGQVEGRTYLSST